MNAMTCGEEFRAPNVGQKLSLGPLGPDMFQKPEHSAATPFQRPSPDIVSVAIPVFFIGRNRDGFWVARDAEGKFGGIFLRKEGALRFAKESARPDGCAAVFPQARLELDIQNAGNPLAVYMAAVMRLLANPVYRILDAIRKTALF